MSAHKFDGYTKLSSGHLDGAKFDPVQRRMTVRFQNGYCYEVHGISADSYQAFIEAPSQGEHWHANIKDHYPVHRVR